MLRVFIVNGHWILLNALLVFITDHVLSPQLPNLLIWKSMLLDFPNLKHFEIFICSLYYETFYLTDWQKSEGSIIYFIAKEMGKLSSHTRLIER